MRKKLINLSLLLLIGVLLSACGQSGKLYLPTDEKMPPHESHH